MATNKPRHGYERTRSQLATKTKGRKIWTDDRGEFTSQKKTQRRACLEGFRVERNQKIY
jgi:hypothetical protein